MKRELEITLAPAMWAPFRSTLDLSGIQEGNEVPLPFQREGHWFRPKGSGRITAGKADEYGLYKDWEQTLSQEENELQYDWKDKRTTASKDYYVVMSLSPDRPLKSLDVDCGSFYNDRLFVYGRYLDSKDKDPIPRYKLMQHLETIGLRAGADYWDPVSILAGYKNGLPRFDVGLRAETDYGPRWFDVKERILKPGKLPEGYMTDFYPDSISARIYVDEDINLNDILDSPGISESTLEARVAAYKTLVSEGKSHEHATEESMNLLHIN